MSGLSIDAVTVRFGTTVAVDDVSLEVPTGRVLAILGPSGCGKSTLMRAVAGLESLQHGRIRYDGTDITDVPTHQRGFAMMFQDGQLFMHTDVAGNVGYPLSLRGVSRADRARRVSELLELVDLPGYGARRPGTLSGGEQQRVALARALAAQPRLLLLDEPLSALDRSLRERLAVDLRAALTATGTTAMLVTHDHDEAATVADDLAVMREGVIVQHGPVTQVWRAPADPDTARFLGYPTILAAEAITDVAALLPEADPGRAILVDALAAGSRLAMRRGALRRNASGHIHATVSSAVASRDEWRLDVDVPGIGVLPALADDAADLAVGDPVRLALRPDQCAVLPA